MKSLFKNAFVVATLVTLAGCSGVTVNTDFDEQINFKELKTYDWHPISSKATNDKEYNYNALVQSRIEDSIDKELSNRGYQQSDQADFYVNYSVTTDDKVDVTTYNTYSGFGPRWGWRGAYGYSSMPFTETTVVNEYKVGTLIIDVVEPESNLLIWRGFGSKTLPESFDKDELDELVKKVVGSILEEFPPENKK